MPLSRPNRCPTCGEYFDGGVDICPHDDTPLQIAIDYTLPAGTIIDGHYRIERELGHGGMGVVYLATDTWLDRPCALKVLATSLSNPRALARFRREAKTLSQINHAHIVTLYGFRQTDDGLAYIAMQYLEGQTLASLLKERIILSPREAMRIVTQIAKALAAAHELGIVHRDLTPRNILLTRYGQYSDFVKVVDFGIARAFGETRDPSMTSSIMGTPEYMSPEQWRSPHVDHRSDIYSLGLIATCILAGGLPPQPPQLMLSGRDVIDAIPTNDWPQDLKLVLARCLDADVDRRFQTAVDFAAAFTDAVIRWNPGEQPATEFWNDGVPSGGGLVDDNRAAAIERIKVPTRLLVTYLIGAIIVAVAIGLGIWYSIMAK